MPGQDNAFTAMAALSLLILFNIATIVGYLKVFDSSNIKNFKAFIFSFAIMVLVINYLVFIHKKRYEKIETKFISESQKQRKARSFIVLTYILLTFILLLCVLFNN